MSQGPVVLISGGTGGHLYPAVGLGEALQAHRVETQLITDTRGHRFLYANPFARVTIQNIARGTRITRPFIYPLSLAFNFARCLAQFIRQRPRLVIGFGGYPSLPGMLAALALRIPTAIQEQNATLGRANRFLARYVRFIFTSFKPETPTQTTVHMGHIVRSFIEALYTQTPYPPQSQEGHFCLSIIGGSQGAKILSTVVPEAIALLPPALQAGLRVYHQCRDEYAEQAHHVYSQTQATVTLQPFFKNMDALYQASHLMITRSGASTVAELCLTGRPAILVPFAAALEGDQTHNANYLERHGAAVVLPERALTAQNLATHIRELMETPTRLAALSSAVRSLATPQASQKLANYIAEKL